MAKKTKARKRRRGSKQKRHPAKVASRAGSNAGRGFRYQDAVSAWLAVEIWAGRRAPAILIPEGGDDVELRGEETSFIQVKSRREHLGDYTEGETAGHIEHLWDRSLGSSPQPERLGLVLERNVAGLALLEEQPTNRSIEGPITARLSKFSAASDFLPKTAIIVATSPQEWAISLIVDRLNCSPIAAQMCFAGLLVRVGALADANGRLAPGDYRGLSISDTETLIRDVLAAVDVDAIERALREGVCEPVDFLTPLDDPNFYLGVDVEPGHLAAGLVAERPRSRSALVEGIEERRAALIVGPSGAGKSALMWEAANTLRHTVRWFRIRRLSTADIPAVRQLIRTFRASVDSPLGFVMDDIGRSGPESWGTLLKEAMSVPGVVLLGSVREEDVTLIAERAQAAEVRADPDSELAERLWQELREAGMTDWVGWREPWKLSDGLLLEYVHILTRGRRMQEVLADQVAARISDPARSLELDILRSCAWAGAANAEIDASQLASTLSVSEADLSRALQRLIQEHLVRSPAPGMLAGLHQLRSQELLHLTHQTVLPTLETSFERTVAGVPATDLEPLVADALSARRLPVPAVLSGSIARLKGDPDARALASALQGLGAGRIAAGVDEWLDTPEARALPRTQVGTAAMLGIAGVDLGSLDIIPEVQVAADRLSRIKGTLEDDPRRLLIERMAPSTLASLITTADLASLDEVLLALVGVPLSAAVRTALRQVPTSLLNADLKLVGSVVGTLTALDPEIAIQWVNEVGQAALFAKIQAETAALTPPAISSLEASGAGSGDTNIAVTKFQNLLHSASVNLIKRFAGLPEQAGAYIAWLSSLIADVDTAISEEPWQLIGDGSPPTLTRLKTLLETLRLLAGEAHERQEPPVVTWAARGKGARAGDALRLVSVSANASGERRLAQRKTEIERSAKEAGIDSVFHLRIDATGLLPWPPADVLALLSASNVADAVIALAQHADQLRSLVDSRVRLTIMPIIDDFVFPALAKSGHQTLLPNVEDATVWAESLGLPCAPSAVAGLFGEVLGLAGELGAMDREGLGTLTRPEEEVIAYRSLESSFATKREALIRRLDALDIGLRTDVSELVEHLRTGDIDFAAEAQAAIGGVSTEIVETTGYLTLLLIESEWQADAIEC